ncbi:MAG TPA: hypothetical protein VHM25_26525 [Polyangiaceae bacterium]|jgi:hypothetical protein|nr:hypothetical protein [Polyangiaceae bacterium]
MLRNSRHSGRAERPRFVSRLGLGLWFCAMLLVGASLLAKHLLALPAPPIDAKLAASLSALRDTGLAKRWLAVHVLNSTCRCSRNIANHLIASTRPKGWDEVVLWAGSESPDPALLARLRVIRVTEVDLARLGIQAAPLLAVLDPGNRLRYVGGYSPRKQGPQIEDGRIFDQVQSTAMVAALPVFGCAVSERLREQLSIVRGL